MPRPTTQQGLRRTTSPLSGSTDTPGECLVAGDPAAEMETLAVDGKIMGMTSQPSDTVGQALRECGKRFLLVFADRFSLLSASMGLSVYPLVSFLTPLPIRAATSFYKNPGSIWWTRLTVLMLCITLVLFAKSPRLASQFSSPIAMEVIVTMSRLMVFAEEVVGWAAYSLLVEEEHDRPGGGSAGGGSSDGVGGGGRTAVALSKRFGATKASPGTPSSCAFGGLGAAAGSGGGGRIRANARFYSFCTANAFFVEQLVWLAAFLVLADTATLNAAGLGLYFASCLWWCSFPVVVNAALTFLFLNAYMCSWIYPPDVRAVMNGTPHTFGGSAFLSRVYAAYGCSLLLTTFLTESHAFAESRARLVEAVTTAPQRLLRSTRNARLSVLVVEVYTAVLEMFDFVDFFFCMTCMLYVSLMLLSERVTVTLGLTVLFVMVAPSLTGNLEEWEIEPALAVADALACIALYLVIIIFIVAVVPLSAMPFMAKGMVCAFFVLFAAAHANGPNAQVWPYMTLFLVFVVLNFDLGGPAPRLPPLVVRATRGGRNVIIERVNNLQDLWDVLVADVKYGCSLPLEITFNWAVTAALLQCLVVTSVHCAILNVKESARRRAQAAAQTVAQANTISAAAGSQTRKEVSGTFTTTSASAAKAKGTAKQKDPKPIKATSKKVSTASSAGTAVTRLGSLGKVVATPTMTTGRARLPHSSSWSSSEASGSGAGTANEADLSADPPLCALEKDSSEDSSDDFRREELRDATQQENSDPLPSESEPAGITQATTDSDNEIVAPDEKLGADTISSHAQLNDLADDTTTTSATDDRHSGASPTNESQCTLSDSSISQVETGRKSHDRQTAANAKRSVSVEADGAVKGGKRGSAASTSSVPQTATGRPAHSPTEPSKHTAVPTKVSKATEKKTGASVATHAVEEPPRPTTRAKERKSSQKEKEGADKREVAVASKVSVAKPSAPAKSTPAVAAPEAESRPADIPLPRSSHPTNDVRKPAKPKTAAEKVVGKKRAAGPTATKTQGNTQASAPATAPVPSADSSLPFALPKPRHEQSALSHTTTPKMTPTELPAAHSPGRHLDGDAEQAVTQNAAQTKEKDAQATAANAEAETDRRGNYFLSFLQPVLDSQKGLALSAATESPAAAVTDKRDELSALSSRPPETVTTPRATSQAPRSDGVSGYEGLDTSGISLDVSRWLQWMNDESEVSPSGASRADRGEQTEAARGSATHPNDARALFEVFNQAHNGAYNSDTAPRASADLYNATAAPTWNVTPHESAAVPETASSQNLSLFSTSAPLHRARTEVNGMLSDEYGVMGGDTVGGPYVLRPGEVTASSWPTSALGGFVAGDSSGYRATAAGAFSTVPRRSGAHPQGPSFTGGGSPGSASLDNDAFSVPSVSSVNRATMGVLTPRRHGALTPAGSDTVDSQDSHIPGGASGLYARSAPASAPFASPYTGIATGPGLAQTSPPQQSFTPMYHPSVAQAMPAPSPPATQGNTPPMMPAVPAGQVALVRLPDGRLTVCPVVFVEGRSCVAAPYGSTIVTEALPPVFYGMAGQSSQPSFPVASPFGQQLPFQRNQ